MDSRQCSKCGEVKPIGEFYSKSKCQSCVKTRGSQIPPSSCSVCRQQKDKSAYRWNSRTGYKTECVECERTSLRCTRCKEIKPIESFGVCASTRTGRNSICNNCHRVRVMDRYRNVPGVREASIAKSKTPEAKAVRKKWSDKRKEDPEIMVAQREYGNKYRRTRYATDPWFRQKIAARSEVGRAVREGQMVRPTTCQHPTKYSPSCGGVIEAHHHLGYAREHWLDVEWLCFTCHEAADAKQKQPPE